MGADLLLCALLFSAALAVLCACFLWAFRPPAAERLRGGQPGRLHGKRPDRLVLDVVCPPAGPEKDDLDAVVVGRVRGVSRAAPVFLPTPSACARACADLGERCSGWAFAGSTPQGGAGGHACQVFTVDDKDIVIHPPEGPGDYISNSLMCVARSGPNAVTDAITEAAVGGRRAALVSEAGSAEECLKRCEARAPPCIGASFHEHDSTCHLYQSPEGLRLRTLPGTRHATSASLFAGEFSIPVEPAPLPLW